MFIAAKRCLLYNRYMNKNPSSTAEAKQGIFEKGFRWDRNFNILLGAGALAGAYMTVGLYSIASKVLTAVAAYNLLQAGADEVGYRLARNKRLGKSATRLAR